MALHKLAFTKSWAYNTDGTPVFPTYETREEQVREDLQLLHDETKTAFNQLIDDLAADEIPFESSVAVEADNVQDAIENVQAQLAGVAMGSVPDGSVTQSKLSDVSSADGAAVGTNQIKDGAVTHDKLGTAAVSSANIGSKEVKTANLDDGCVTAAKIASDALPTKADLDGGILARTQFRLRFMEVAFSGSQALTLSHMGRIISVVSGDNTGPGIPTQYVIQRDSSIPTGSFVVIVNRRSAGMTVIAPYTAQEVKLSGYNRTGDQVNDPISLTAGQTVILFKLSDVRWVAACFQ